MKATFTLTEDEIRVAIHTYLGDRGFRGDHLNKGPVLNWLKPRGKTVVRACYENKE